MKLINFKAFRRLELPLGPLTLLTGLNSSGKSSVLQALGLLRQSYETQMLIRTKRAGGGLLLNGDLVALGTAQDVLHEDFGPVEELPAVNEPLVGLVIEEDGEQRTWVAAYDIRHPDRDVMPLAEGSVRSHLAEQPFQYLHADRITPAVTYPRSHQIAIARGFLGVRGEHTVNYLRHHTEQDVPMEVPDGPLRHRGATSSQLLDQTIAWMQELCPGVNIETDPVEGTDSVRLSYGFGGTAGINATRRRRPTHVGFGEPHLNVHLDWIRAARREGVTTGSRIWDSCADLYPHLRFLPRVEGQLSGLNPHWVVPVRRALERLEEAVAAWDPASVAEPEWRTKVSPEGETRKRVCRFTDLDGETRTFDLHARFTPGAGRIHFRLVPEERMIRIAHIGSKIRPEI